MQLASIFGVQHMLLSSVRCLFLNIFAPNLLNLLSGERCVLTVFT